MVSHMDFNLIRFNRLNKIALLPLAVLMLIFLMEPALAETEADQLQKGVSHTIEIRQQTQKKEDAWAGKKVEIMAHYRSLKASQEHLRKLKLKTEKAFIAQKARVEESERRIKESARIREELQSYLESVVAQLERFINKDLPFLSKERGARISSIKETMTRPDRPAAEKYRRVVEALQVETEYGRTVEVYQDTINLDGEPVLVDILRLGRLSLFCQTPDGKVVGHYDPPARRWVSLPSSYRREINKGMEMARGQRNIELVSMPIGRITP